MKAFTGPRDPKLTFENFRVSDGTGLAHLACSAVADAPGESYHPLYLHGPADTGKTHLLQAIFNRLAETRISAPVVYTTMKALADKLRDADATGRIQDFRAGLWRADVLLVDDVEFLSVRMLRSAAAPRLHHELLLLMRALWSNDSQLVLAADRGPQNLNGTPPQLRDYFQSGLVVEMAKTGSLPC